MPNCREPSKKPKTRENFKSRSRKKSNVSTRKYACWPSSKTSIRKKWPNTVLSINILSKYDYKKKLWFKSFVLYEICKCILKKFAQSVEFADEFQEIREIIDRYETLTTNYKDLLEIEKQNEERINTQRKKLNIYTEVYRFTAVTIFIFRVSF